jgi:hypothetical protein
MIDVNAYRNTMKVPRREDYTEVVIATSSKGERKEVKFFNQQEYNKARDLYFAENTRLWNLFVDDLKEELGITDNPKAGLLISKAIDNSSGDYQSVIDWCSEMVDLIS